jgi:hypothetical protein
MIIRVAPPIPRWLGAVLASATLVAAVTAVIALLEPGVPPSARACSIWNDVRDANPLRWAKGDAIAN